MFNAVSNNADFIGQRQRVGISAESNIGFLFAIRSDQSVHASNLGIIKSFESFLDLRFGGAQSA